MIETTYKGWTVRFNGDQRLYNLMDRIIAGKELPIQKEIKNTSRSLVLLVSALGRQAVLKSPREKNARKWIRFTTLYREGEAFKAIANMEMLQKLGIESNKPFLAMEKRHRGMVVDSWLLYEYVPGKACREKDYPDVVRKLKAIHTKKILHGDPQIDNFITAGKRIVTIDCNPQKALFGNISRFYEYYYLVHSAPEIEQYISFPIRSLAGRIAKAYSQLYWAWRDHKKKRRHRMSDRSPLKILVIRLSSIGDVILTTPVLAAIKKKYPHAELHYLVMDRFEQAITGNPHVDHLIRFPKSAYRGLRGIIRFSRILRKNRYDLIIDLHAKIRSILFSMLAGGRILRYKKRSLWKSILVPLRLARYQVDGTIVENYFGPLKKVGVNFSGEPLALHISEHDRSTVKRYDRHVVMAPGAANNTKKWPEAHFADLGNLLKEQIILVGGKQDFELCEKIRHAIGTRCENLAGRLTLKESGALMSTSRFVVANDSGPFHIARAVSANVFVIFGPTDPGMFDYDRKAILVYADAPCAPCSLHGDEKCPKGHFDCMQKLTPEKVFTTIRSFLHPPRHQDAAR